MSWPDPVRRYVDALPLTGRDLRRLLPGRLLSRFCCPTCGERVKVVWLHPDEPRHWQCAQCLALRKGLPRARTIGNLLRARDSLLQGVKDALNNRQSLELAEQPIVPEAPTPYSRRARRTHGAAPSEDSAP